MKFLISLLIILNFTFVYPNLITVSISSINYREKSLEKTISTLLPQVDRINVFLQGYKSIPTFLNHPKILAVEGDNYPIILSLGDAAKFFWAEETKGYHFICDDTDEMFAANCQQDDWLRKKIFALEAGQALIFPMTHPWRGFEYYRNDNSRWSPKKRKVGCIFCDDGQCNYRENQQKADSGFIHVHRLPCNRKNRNKDIFISNIDYNLIHFRFVNWDDNAIKQAWYMCLELIRAREGTSQKEKPRTAKEINYYYRNLTNFNETNMVLAKTKPEWFSYPFFNQECYIAEVTWRKKQVLEWFNKYGIDFFKELDIWHINWYN